MREKVNQGVVEIAYVGTKYQLADLLVKGLGSVQHNLLMLKLCVLNIFSPFL